MFFFVFLFLFFKTNVKINLPKVRAEYTTSQNTAFRAEIEIYLECMKNEG